MNFETFETEFLLGLSNKSKNCFSLLDQNRKLVQAYFGKEGNQTTIDKFINEVNLVVLKTKNNFNYIKKILTHDSFKDNDSNNRFLESFRNGNVLIEACKTGNKNAAKWLLTMGMNSMVQDKNGMSALMYAAENINLLSVVKYFINDKFCLDLVDENDENVIFHALRNTNALMELVKSNANINQINRNNESALLYCSKNELYTPLIILLSNESINVNFVDNEEKTVAMYLAENGRYLELSALNNRKCNYSFINSKLESVLSIVIKNLYGEGSKDSKVLPISYLQILAALAESNCDFNIPIDDDENTAIMIFIIVNDYLTLDYVLNNAKGIDLSKKNVNGENATSLYVKSKNNISCKSITNNNTFDYNYIDGNNNNTLLMLAAMNQPLLVRKIIENNISVVDSTNNKNENALILAVKSNNVKSVEELLRYEILIDQQDHLGNTALYYAVEQNNVEIVEKLIYNKADANIKNIEGKSALDIAHEMGNKSILNYITNPSLASPSSSFYQDDLSKIKRLVSEGNISDKYSEIEEYLYPWINNSYPGFKMTTEYKYDAERVYREAKNKNIKREMVNSYNSNNELYGLEGYALIDVLSNLLFIVLGN